MTTLMGIKAAPHKIRGVFPRRSLRVLGVAVGIFVVAAIRALTFWKNAPIQPYVDLSWDPASHVLIGLDLFDALRRLELASFLKRAFNEHWWPPLFGLLTLPLHALLGRSDLPARVLSLLSIAALPAMCAVAVTALTRSTVAAATGIALTLTLFLTSPQLVEMSHWPMLEGIAAAMGLASMLAFSMSERPGWHRLAFVLAGSSTLLKYHYGFFLLITLTGGVLLRLPAAERSRLMQTLLALLRKPAVAITVLILAVITFLPDAISDRVHWIPRGENVPWLVYAASILTVSAVPALRRRARTAWMQSSPVLKDWVRFGLAIPGVWCLDPANARVWYREIRLASEPPAVFDDQVHRLLQYVTYDYFASPIVVVPAIAVGVIALLVLRPRATAVPLALHGLWPLLLMTGSSYRAEARFIASLMPVLMAAGILGWVALLDTLRPVRQVTVALTLGVVIAITLFAASARADELTQRKIYRYRYAPEEGQFVKDASDALARGMPALVILPADGEVAPALRLFLRMRMPDVAPDDVFVMKGDASELARRAQRVRTGVIAFEKGWDHPPDLIPIGEVPLPQGGGRSLLITERR